ncbi:hypothetical protein ABE236_27295, partial [Priestia endophytica]|uniref:CD3337/EF1877 family mobilome membrane protein n=1 Tax=Priestia endophytica TaxID=135735 RepID=UPI003D2E1C7D
MKRFLASLLMICGLVFFLAPQPTVLAANPQNDFVPQNPDEKQVGKVPAEYNKYPFFNYDLDTYVDTGGDWLPWNWKDGAGKQIFLAVMQFMEFLWTTNVMFSYFVMFVAEKAFSLDFVSAVVGQIAEAIRAIAGFNGGFRTTGLFPLLGSFMIILVGTWAIWVGLIKRQTSRAGSGLLSSFVIMVCAFGYFGLADQILKKINDGSAAIQSEVLSASASIVNPGTGYNQKEGIATVRNQMFDLMIKKPYLLMQYGVVEEEEIKKEDKDRVDNLLALDPNLKGEEREKIAEKEVKDYKNEMMGLNGIKLRAGMVPLVFIADIIIGILVLLLSCTMIFYQILFLILALLGPVAFIIGMVPAWQHTATNWFKKLIDAALIKIAVGLLLTMLFTVSGILYRASSISDLGYMGVMLVQIIAYLGIWTKRREIFGMLNTVAGGVASSTGQSLANYKNRLRQAKGFLSKMSRPSERLQNTDVRNRKPTDPQRQIFLSKEQQKQRMAELKKRQKGRINPAMQEVATTTESSSKNKPQLDNLDPTLNPPNIVELQAYKDKRQGKLAGAMIDRFNPEGAEAEQIRNVVGAPHKNLLNREIAIRKLQGQNGEEQGPLPTQGGTGIAPAPGALQRRFKQPQNVQLTREQLQNIQGQNGEIRTPQERNGEVQNPAARDLKTVPAGVLQRRFTQPQNVPLTHEQLQNIQEQNGGIRTPQERSGEVQNPAIRDPKTVPAVSLQRRFTQSQNVQLTREQLQNIQEQNGGTQIVRSRPEITPGPTIESPIVPAVSLQRRFTQPQNVQLTREQLQNIQEQNGGTQIVRNRPEATPGPTIESPVVPAASLQRRFTQPQNVQVTREQLQNIQEQNGGTQIVRNRAEMTPGPTIE